MKRWIWLILTIGLLFGCASTQEPVDRRINAKDHGVLPENTGLLNSQNLQKLIDELSLEGGTIYIPAGEYQFSANGTQAIGDHCIKMKSNVSILGDGEKTVLMPVGDSQFGLDMFYFNDYLDTGEGTYLENCSFQNFVIDAAGTSCETYTSAGKGFMLNLIRNCHWENVTVKNTDATGFGVDCPLDCTITNCVAIGCGKAAGEESPGASGFGIGYGYCDGEEMIITDCYAENNRKFGFFFEHQGRFDGEKYDLSNQGSFLVIGSTAKGNLYNFGGIRAKNVTYRQCDSQEARKEEVYFEECADCSYNGVLAAE